MDKSLISVVIPVKNEGSQIFENVLVIRNHLSKTGLKSEIVLIDDGSTDDTWLRMKMLSEEIPGVKALKLSRNFGKEAALCAGLEAVSGDACVIIDADLQHPPELIPEMVRLWRDEGYDVVEGVKQMRGNESPLNKAGAWLFYNILSKLSGFDIMQASDFKLLDRKVIEAWRTMNERDTFFRGMSAWVGFNRISIPFTVKPRTEGTSKWSPIKLVKLALGAITSFSSMPLHIVTFIGLIFLACSLILGVQTLYMKLAGRAMSGFTTVILLLLIIGSTLMISLGVIGAYIARIYEEVKQRPRFIVAEEIASRQGLEDIKEHVHKS